LTIDPLAEGPPTLPSGLRGVTKESGLEYFEIVPGSGREALPGARVRVHFRGWTSEGNLFDSTDARGPVAFTLGEGEVIAALDEGVAGMRVGGRRRLIAPSDLAYGSRGNGKAVPPYATLILDIELVAVS
jgi:peptidylprolyl isomerase